MRPRAARDERGRGDAAATRIVRRDEDAATPRRRRGDAADRPRRKRGLRPQVFELKFLDARGALEKKGHGDVPIWAMCTEDLVQRNGLEDPTIPTDGYVDDGEKH